MRKFHVLYAFIALVLVLPIKSAHAAARTWANTGTDFNAGASWGGTAPGANDVGLFASASVTQPNVTTSTTIAGLRFNDLTSGYDITGSVGVVLTINGVNTTGSGGTTTASASTIRNDNVTGTTTLDVNLNLAPSTLIATIFQEAGDAGILVLNGTIAETGTVALSLKNGTIQLNGANTYSGGTTIDAAGTTVVVGNDSGLGTGTYTVNNTSNLQAGGGARTIANSVNLAGSLTIGGTSNFIVNGNVTASAALTRTLTVNNSATTTLGGNVFLSDSAGTGRTLVINGTGNVTISGAIADFNGVGTAGTLSHGGSGTLTLTNANTYTGGTNLSGGTTISTHNGAFGTGNVSLTANNVTLTLQGVTNSIADTASLSIGLVGNTGDVVNLNFSGTETVFSLSVNGAQQPAGVYGPVGSGAQFELAQLMGTGTLTALTQIPEPATYMLLGFGILVCAQQFRRKKS